MSKRRNKEEEEGSFLGFAWACCKLAWAVGVLCSIVFIGIEITFWGAVLKGIYDGAKD